MPTTPPPAIACPCGRHLRTKPEWAGKRIKCPHCDAVHPVPGGRRDDQNTVSLVVGESPAEATVATNSPAASDGVFDFLSPPESPGELGRLGGYRVLRVLGKGGMGVVFLAEDVSLRRPVALKAMLPKLADHPGARERFFREARAAAALKHPHVVAIYQVGEDRGAPFLAMEFLEGESLDDRAKRERVLPTPEVIRIGREVALGLGAAHKRGLVHRDIKPGNVWLEGESGSVKILDFGLARGNDGEQQITQSGMIVGTPAYMSPEQARGGPIDPRADLYSLGVLLYRLTTGRVPFEHRDTMALLTALALETPVPTVAHNPDVPAELDRLIGRLLAKRPEDRPQSAAEVVAALDAMRGERPSEVHAAPSVQRTVFDDLDAEPPAPRPKVGRPKRRRPLVAVAAAFGLLALSVGLVVFWTTPSGKPPGEGEGAASANRKKDATVRPEPPKVAPPEVEDLAEWRGRVERMPPERRIEAVRAKLAERNGCEVNNFFFFKTPTRRIACLYNTRLRDLSPIHALDVTDLDVKPATELADLRTLEGLPLRYLSLTESPVTDLSPLRRLPLAELHLYGPGKPLDLGPLAGLPLRRLTLTDRPITDLSPLRGLPLAELSIDGCAVTDSRPLAGLKLEHLSFTTPFDGGLGFLRGMPLRGLRGPIDWGRDQPHLAGLRSLETVGERPARGVALRFDYEGPKTFIPTLTTDLAGEITIEIEVTMIAGNEAKLFGTDSFSLGFRNNGQADLQYPPKAIWLVSFDSPWAHNFRRRHLAAVKTRDSVSFYLDGRQVDRRAFDGPGKLATAEPFWIAHGVSALFHSVRVSRVARYHTDYASPQHFEPDADTLALYRCDEGEGDTLTDSSGNGHHVQLPEGEHGARWVWGVLPPVGKPLPEAWVRRVSALKGAEQFKEVQGRLRMRNPLFDGPMATSADGGTVTQLRLSDPTVFDIESLRLLSGLKRFDYRGTNVADVSPLKGLPLEAVDCDFDAGRDAAVLRAIPTLKTVNGKPAAEFWKKRDAVTSP